MIQLVLVYCLSSDAKACFEKRLAMENFPTPAACVSGAQQRAIEFLSEHPQYHLKGWRCEVDVPKQTPT